ncbi:hypothetical protein M413DRAFT_32413 [Hebeloma cylindrosporum]|uniref:Uncharacterized protein n=1 Tax=Hebeloma cylindrosporum TaxID=76867 RepID=A0A0C3BTY9_HEBCY|nr:hypothetical protein M413DRAFT_32413 [Hebeloma cylindrosporum h7]
MAFLLHEDTEQGSGDMQLPLASLTAGFSPSSGPTIIPCALGNHPFNLQPDLSMRIRGSFPATPFPPFSPISSILDVISRSSFSKINHINNPSMGTRDTISPWITASAT